MSFLEEIFYIEDTPSNRDELVKVLVNCTCMQTLDDRIKILKRLPEDVWLSIREDKAVKDHVTNIVDQCADFSNEMLLTLIEIVIKSDTARTTSLLNLERVVRRIAIQTYFDGKLLNRLVKILTQIKKTDESYQLESLIRRNIIRDSTKSTKVPQNMKEYIIRLDDMLHLQMTEYHPIFKFALQVASYFPSYEKQLKNWVASAARSNKIDHRLVNLKEANNLKPIGFPKIDSSHLLVEIEKHPGQDQVKLRAWFYSEEFPFGDNIYEADDFFDRCDIPQVLDTIIRHSKWRTLDNLIVELLVPFELLLEDYNQWQVVKDPWGLETDSLEKLHSVVLRSWDRMHYLPERPEFYISWKNRWLGFQSGFEPCSFSERTFDLKNFLKLDRDDNVGSVVFDCSTNINNDPTILFKFLVKMGIPVAMWLRNEDAVGQLGNIIKELKEECNCMPLQHFNIPHIFKGKRCLENHLNNIYQQVSLLWENPFILTPDTREKIKQKTIGVYK